MEILSTGTWILIIIGIVLFGGTVVFGKRKAMKQHAGLTEIVAPLMIQAFERLVLYLERIRFSVLVKRVFVPGMSRSDLQFAMIQSVQDEFEHNLAQRLYVSEEIWMMVVLTKDEVLKGINEAFGANPEADAATMAQIIASKSNSYIDRTVIAIKKELNGI
jgi:hypothetical protein